jgi:hypothetical protein
VAPERNQTFTSKTDESLIPWRLETKMSHEIFVRRQAQKSAKMPSALNRLNNLKNWQWSDVIKKMANAKGLVLII